MPEEAGPDLDRKVAEWLHGAAPAPVSKYSTEERAGEALLATLRERGVAFTVQEIDGVHYCIIWKCRNPPRERLAIGSAAARPLAICRAVLKLRLPPPSRGPARSHGTRPPSAPV